MPKKTETPKAVTSGSELSQIVELQDIRLIAIDAGLVANQFSDKLSISIAHSGVGEFSSEDHKVRVLAQFKLEACAEDPESKPSVRIRAAFELTYRVPDDVHVLQEAVQQFAKANGVFNAWPYWREIVHSTTTRMGLPGFVAPVLRLGQTAGELSHTKQKAITRKRTPRKKLGTGH